MTTDIKYLHTLAQAAVKGLVDDGFIQADSHDTALESVKRRYSTLTAEVTAQIQKSPKQRKTRNKPRNKSAYNVFCSEQNEVIKAQLVAVDGVKPKYMAKASEMWKSLSDADKLPYKQKATEINNATAVSTDQVASTPVVVPESDIEGLAGPFEGTFIGGGFGNKSFKTFDDAYKALCDNQNAIGIVMTNKGRYKLRRGIRFNKANLDKNGQSTPPFVYTSPKGETSWAWKVAIDNFATQGPYTRARPYVHQIVPVAKVVAEPEPKITPDTTTVESEPEVADNPVQTEVSVNSEPKADNDDSDSDDDDSDSDDDDDNSIKVSYQGKTLWTFTSGEYKGYLFEADENGFDEEDYIGMQIKHAKITEGQQITDDDIDKKVKLP